MLRSNKAIKSIKLLFQLYKDRILNGINETLIIITIMFMMYIAGLCYGGDCAYVEVTDYTNQGMEYFTINETTGYPTETSINEPSKDYLLANKLFNWAIVTAVISMIIGVYRWDDGRKRKKV